MRTIEEIITLYPNFNWLTYFTALNLEKVDKVNILSPGFMTFLNEYLPTLSIEQIKDYLIFEVVSSSTGLLSDDFYDADFEMYDRVMSGKEDKKPRWKRAMSIPNSMFGEAVGKLYVSKYFPPENKKHMLTLVSNLQNALTLHIKSLTWMTEQTKVKALEKLNTLTIKIGYPDKWKDYSEINIDTSKSYLSNVLEASKWYHQDNYKKLGKPVDKEEWLMTPQTVNAYYNPTSNEICFPAAILQPPYFDATADDAQNYGAIGVVIGHEMTHGFDDQGRQYDKNGNLSNWWEQSDIDAFNQLADGLVNQFNAVEVAPGVHANGKYTLGENIADQGGLRIALTAYLNSDSGKTATQIDGFSPIQRFYLAYANLWANNIRDEEVLVRVKTDPHSLGKNRVNTTLQNIDQFFEAFSITPSNKMWKDKDERIIIW
jgi:putative endopeptidase